MPQHAGNTESAATGPTASQPSRVAQEVGGHTSTEQGSHADMQVMDLVDVEDDEETEEADEGSLTDQWLQPEMLFSLDDIASYSD